MEFGCGETLQGSWAVFSGKEEIMTVLFVILCVVCFGWMIFMMTFRTDDWLRLLKEEEERKAKRHERAGNILKGAVSLASWLSKK